MKSKINKDFNNGMKLLFGQMESQPLNNKNLPEKSLQFIIMVFINGKAQHWMNRLLPHVQYFSTDKMITIIYDGGPHK